MNSRIHVFLIAGNRLLREALTRVLRKRDDIVVAGSTDNPQQALEQVRASRCEVLLWEASGSDGDSMEFVSSVRAAMPKTRIVIIGMHGEEEFFLRAVRLGVAGFVLRDASAQDVVAAVRTVAEDEVFCPPPLCRYLFRYVAHPRSELPSVRLRIQLGLTRREQQLVPLIARGCTNKEIASQLHLSEQTVKNHIHRMLHKVGAGDRLTIVEMCRGQGLSI